MQVDGLAGSGSKRRGVGTPDLSPLRTRSLVGAASEEQYRLYRAALEWALEDPIVIDSKDDLKSAERWRELVDPYQHQVSNLITFCRRLPVTLLADDVGLGKTISAGLIASELISRNRVSRILIVCPKLLIPQWAEELKEKFNIPSIEARGGKLVKAEPKGPVGAVLTTYESARTHLEKIPDGRFQMLVLDEAHKLRNLYGVDPTPQVAIRFKKALSDRMFKYVLMLTATPIQNRLWDLYSLVDLLCAAKGHENPFGKEGAFVRNYIADDRTQARHLRPEARERLRSIVYGYMSRVRREDANLSFPDRIVRHEKAIPTAAESQLFKVIGDAIESFNRLDQIGILQDLVSSPHAVLKRIENKVRNGTGPAELPATVASVKEIVRNMGPSSKLKALGTLIAQLREERPAHWRAVVFTERRETQTTIQQYLEDQGITVGLINGDSGQRNQDTIERFRADPPNIHVIVSTRAGSEGVNLQAANVLVNYDLPWNPMIVEQRIGRVQRLASTHANVCIFNVTLAGTFEEYIVGRLMEKLQMASHAIGDVDSLLEALDDEGDNSHGFEERIRRLVVDALVGRDFTVATVLAEKSILQAKAELEREKSNIDRMLGTMEVDKVGPRTPQLPVIERSMNAKTFAVRALEDSGATVSGTSDGSYVCELDGRRDLIAFGAAPAARAGTAIVYAPGTPAFERLVKRVSSTGRHFLIDADENIETQVTQLAASWAESFGAVCSGVHAIAARRRFDGTALVRARATVAHDSYERLVEIACDPAEHSGPPSLQAIDPIAPESVDPTSTGLNLSVVSESAGKDTGIAEFCRFYLERRAAEVVAAGTDARKQRKLEDEFTPRIDCVLVGFSGRLSRTLQAQVTYAFTDGPTYTSALQLTPSLSQIDASPALVQCEATGTVVPTDCIAECVISHKRVLKHKLMPSKKTGRLALPEHSIACGVSGEIILCDEAEKSDLTGRWVSKELLKTSAASGRRGESEHFGACEFTGTDVLRSELGESLVSAKSYRVDQQAKSDLSGVTGHRSEFLTCVATGACLLPSESEKCASTGKAVAQWVLEPCALSGARVLPGELLTSDMSGRRALRSYFVKASNGEDILQEESERCATTGSLVRRGTLEVCAVSNWRVLPSELERCTVSGRRALKQFFVTSSVSGARILESEAIGSASGKFCSPLEARRCRWGGSVCHPDDLRECSISGELVHFQFCQDGKLEPLFGLLKGARRTLAHAHAWEAIALQLHLVLRRGKVRIEAADVGPDARVLAVCAEVKSLFKTEHVGFLYIEGSMVGRVAVGKRKAGAWITSESA